MPLFERILVATDFSACAARALDYAILLAAAFSARVELFHVLEIVPGMEQDEVVRPYLERRRQHGDQQLDQLVARVQARGLAVQGRQTVGAPSPSESINAEAGEWGAHLVVLGTQSQPSRDPTLLGRTTELVVAGAPCPVLTVRCAPESGEQRGLSAPAPSADIQRILAPVDFSKCSLDALEYAAQLARRFSAVLRILHVLEPIYHDPELGLSPIEESTKHRAQSESRLSVLAASLQGHELSVQTAIRGGIAAESILDSQQEQGSDMIVMGTHGRRGLSYVVSGSVAEAVLRQADCPVLTVRAAKLTPHTPRLLPDSPFVQ